MFPNFLILQPFNVVLYVVLTSTNISFSFLLHKCNFASVMYCDINMCIYYNINMCLVVLGDSCERMVQIQRLRTSDQSKSFTSEGKEYNQAQLSSASLNGWNESIYCMFLVVNTHQKN